MSPRLAAPFFAATVLVFACGPRKPSPLESARGLATMGKSPAGKSGKGKGVVSHVRVDTASGKVRFAIEVNNDSRKSVELNFPDGRTHDFMVLDDAGREVWRWSAGRMFTQAMQNRLVDANDSVVYAERWSHPAPGRYVLVAQLRSENYPVQQRVEFSLP